MKRTIKKIIKLYLTMGMLSATKKLFLYPINRAKWHKNRFQIFKLADSESRFTRIYETNHWNSEESVSGTGSTLSYTKNLRENLPELIKTFSIKSIFDAPCGDFKWMN